MFKKFKKKKFSGRENIPVRTELQRTEACISSSFETILFSLLEAVLLKQTECKTVTLTRCLQACM